jgi:hypothetical protein
LTFIRKITLPRAKWRHHKRFGSEWKPLLSFAFPPISDGNAA